MKQPYEFKVMPVRQASAPSEVLDSPDRAFAYWQENIPQADWFDPQKENFVVVVLNTRRRALGHNLVTMGNVDSCLVHPREVFRPIIAIAGASAVIMHNHPSLDSDPSESDIRVTRDLIKAGRLLKIELVDHVIVGESHLSLRKLGYFYD